MMYEHFNETLWRKITKEGDDFWDEMNTLREYKRSVDTHCASVYRWRKKNCRGVVQALLFWWLATYCVCGLCLKIFNKSRRIYEFSEKGPAKGNHCPVMLLSQKCIIWYPKQMMARIPFCPFESSIEISYPFQFNEVQPRSNLWYLQLHTTVDSTKK